MDKFKNKYRIPSTRLQTWDYGSDGFYFITICTKNRKHFFGEIADAPVQTPVQTPNLGVSTTIGGKNDKWKPGTIGVIVNQYKRICTINARKIDARFNWQPRFHDHIIRDAKSFERIQNYIASNPQNWKGDKFNL